MRRRQRAVALLGTMSMGGVAAIDNADNGVSRGASVVDRQASRPPDVDEVAPPRLQFPLPTPVSTSMDDRLALLQWLPRRKAAASSRPRAPTFPATCALVT